MEKLTMGYRPLTKGSWQGRIDDANDPDSFRWHQLIKYLDLQKSKLTPFSDKTINFSFLGYCSDLGVRLNLGRPGAAMAPAIIRQELANLPAGFSRPTRLFEAGDIIPVAPKKNVPAQVLAHLTEKIIRLNTFPILLGGGHDIALGHFLGILNSVEQHKKVGIFNLDAHFDLRPYHKGAGSGSMFLQIADLCKTRNLDFSYFVAGIQKYSNTKSLFNLADELGTSYVLAKDINDNDLSPLKSKLDLFTAGLDHIYITVCADVFSSAFAPGVSAPQPFGLHPETVLRILKHVLSSGKAISFDIAEVAPRFDQDNRTAKLAAIVIFALINTLSEI